jgi:hypothetical protein
VSTQGQVSYVSRFLSHLILLGQTLGTESDALQHLRLSPRRLLSSLVFEAKQCTASHLVRPCVVCVVCVVCDAA